MTRQDLLSQIDTAANARLASWVPVQNAYYTQHGRYMQAICTHSVYPADGIATAPDQLSVEPADQPDSLAEMGFTAAPLLAAFSVDTHAGPNGDGWTLNIFVTWQGVTWHRAIGFGEYAATHDWQEVLDGAD